MTEIDDLLRRTRELALRYIESLPTRPVAESTSREQLLEALGPELQDEPLDPTKVIEQLATAAEPGLVATTSGRFFGFVEGGVVPAALAADWLTSVWDQNPGFYVLSPAAAVVEEVAGAWLLEVLGLPDSASVGFTTGAQAANVAGLAAARHHVLARLGYDVEADGLPGAPPVRIIVGEERHATIGRALRFLGFGERTPLVIPSDAQGRMEPGKLRAELESSDVPTIVCAQAGNVNTGAFDPFPEISTATREHGAWLHVDGAFGLWAGASPRLRHLVEGVELADSWATDGHKWLNVPYDSGIVACAHPESHRASMSLRAPYLIRPDDSDRVGTDWTPESSRRARAFAVWAALRSLGKNGVAEMIDRCCEHARRFAEILSPTSDIAVLNDVVLNQVLIRVGDDDERTRRTVKLVQESGRAWLADTVWHDTVAIRISVSDHATTAQDVDLTVAEILRAAEVTA
jgi:glutamate/tyrosine decarboxylase-like PLP-dependent enzyme